MKSAIILATLLGVLVISTNGAGLGPKIDHDSNEVASSDDAASNLDFGSAFRMYIDAFQKIMPCGYKPYDIPALAPFSVDFYDFNFDNTYLQINGNVSNLVITGMNNYRWLNLAYNADTNRMTFDVNYSEMQMMGEYMIDFWAIMAGWPISMPGEGILNWKVSDLRVVGELTLTTNPKNPNGLAITDFNMNFYLGDVAFSDWNSLSNIAMNNFLNRWSREFTLMWVEQYQSIINTNYNELVLPMVNQALENVSMNQLIDFFVDTANVWNSASCNVA